MALLQNYQNETIEDLLAAAWQNVSNKLYARFGDAVYRSWLKPLSFTGSKSGYIQLSVPTRFMREWINKNYIDDIHAFWLEESVAEGYEIELVVVVPASATGKDNQETAPQKFNVLTPQSWQPPAQATETTPLDIDV